MTGIQEKIRTFYDASSGLWEKTWGEHMHHGYYGPNGDRRKDHYQAQIDMISEILNWGRHVRAENILDIGCGIGGSSLHLAERFNAHVVGVTLSPAQAGRARERAQQAGLAGRVSFEVADIMSMKIPAEGFDLVWSLESGEHMPDKKQFLQICHDMLRPGGKLLMATWCHRPTPPTFSGSEARMLRKLYHVYNLPYILSIDQYTDLFHGTGFERIECADWTGAVAPFWPAVARSALKFRSIIGLLQAGWPVIRSAVAVQLMIRGYRRGLIRFGLFQGMRPQE